MLGGVYLGLEGRVPLFDFYVAGLDLAPIKAICFEGLLEGEDVLRLVVALQGLGNLFFALFAAVITMLSESVRVALVSDDVADDLETSDASDVADDVGQLDVHLLQRLLHALGLGAIGANQVIAVADERAEGADFFWGAKGSPE